MQSLPKIDSRPDYNKSGIKLIWPRMADSILYRVVWSQKKRYKVDLA